jgi:UbiA prenyltransferase family
MDRGISNHQIEFHQDLGARFCSRINCAPSSREARHKRPHRRDYGPREANLGRGEELSMKTAAIPAWRLWSPTRARLTARLPDFVTLMKPRVMVLAVLAALVGSIMAPGRLDPFLGSIAVLAIAAGAGAAGVLNMWYDADIDAVMARTAMRPIPRGQVSRVEALVFGLSLPVAQSPF